MMEFNKYYYRFLGVNDESVNDNVVVTECIYRDKPLNKRYFYPVIVSEYNEQKICSSSNRFIDICKSRFDGSIQSIEFILDDMRIEQPSYRLRKMRRYTLESTEEMLDTKAMIMTEEIVRSIQFKGDMDIEKFIERKKDVIKEGRQFIITQENTMAALALISDIYERGCNIAVYTNEDYRKMGYGKEVVKGCINWCNERNLVPIYLVEEQNNASIKLAESLGFKLKSREWIISK
ncbi:GNAT family N-acetyltransferase [Oceanirhabdus sp. W0125-5]|uniref:GNAT family N-acetyltransferase n=1 Tax=Oceanirhabdus sp. W0125-5 TaxID=2999116 RepID=UPI0022F2AD00|nr:GNAT family N-acetyltransferase [Oceanirhabdus sp. W0125-5]WBW96945.1 GNAT family N-acetyltransferase [Oceanirhabdus sp. W0125-5]